MEFYFISIANRYVALVILLFDWLHAVFVFAFFGI